MQPLPVILALDTQDKKQCMQWLETFENHLQWVKVGMELFYTFGPEIIQIAKAKNYKVFLDLKLHDIPNTVAKATETLSRLEVDLLTLHTQGGLEMLSRAQEAIPDGNSLKLLGVTQLTSTSAEMLKSELGVGREMSDSVVGLAKLAERAGLYGVVASPLEVELIKTHTAKLKVVTPGIRFPEDSSDDQKRILTPWDAIKVGSDYLVMGRSLTKAENPLEKIQRIREKL